MAKLAQTKDNPKIVQTTLKDGRISLSLEYYIGRSQIPVFDDNEQPVLYTTGAMAGTQKMKVIHNRKRELLSLYLTAKPRTPEERQRNREILELAEKVRFERSQEFLKDREGYRLQKESRMDFYEYFEGYIDQYTKKDIRMVRSALKCFRDFINQSKRYKRYADQMQLQQLDKEMVTEFVTFLQATHEGEGAHTVFSRFKKAINHAVETNLLTKDPCHKITIRVDKGQLRKDILSQEEIHTLLRTKVKNQNINVRKAFILSLYCGLRYCDVRTLTFSNVDYSNKLLRFEQSKTKEHSSASGVAIPLSDSVLEMIGKGKRNELIFPLPSYTMCIKSLKHWVKRAGIDKHITWHCARHSFATNILINGANIKTVASLLGHSGVQHTDKYLRAVDKLKNDAIMSLGEIEI